MPNGRRMVQAGLAAGIMLACAAGCGRHDAVLQDDQYLVGVQYYMWYPYNFTKGYLRARLDPPQQPSLGEYRSEDVRVIEQHIAWCSRYGIDFLAIDWWPSGPASSRRMEHTLLRARNLDDIRFCIFYETQNLGFKPQYASTPFTGEMTDRFVDEVTAIADALFDHPSYLRVAGRPVFMLYLSRTFTEAFAPAIDRLRKELKKRGHDVFLVGDEVFWTVSPVVAPGQRPYPLTTEPQPTRIRCFDAITAYNMYEGKFKQHAGYAADSRYMEDVGALFARYREAAGRNVCFVPGLTPGFNDRGVRPEADHFAIPRRWNKDAAEGSFFSVSFDRLVQPFIDPRLNMFVVTSWNEWNEDTGIEPLAAAAPTTRDTSESGRVFSQGYAYAGHGMTYLEILRDKVAAVAGRVKDGSGTPLHGIRVTATQEGEVRAADRTDREGYYCLSRRRLRPGDCEVRISEGGPAKTVRVQPDNAVTGVDFRVGSR